MGFILKHLRAKAHNLVLSFHLQNCWYPSQASRLIIPQILIKMAVATNNTIVGRYSRLNAVQLQASDITSLEYSDSEVESRFSYYTMQLKSRGVLRPVYNRVRDSLITRTVTTRTAKDMLDLAVHLEEPAETIGTGGVLQPTYVYGFAGIFPMEGQRTKTGNNIVADEVFPELVGTAQVVTSVQGTSSGGSTTAARPLAPPDAQRTGAAQTTQDTGVNNDLMPAPLVPTQTVATPPPAATSTPPPADTGVLDVPSFKEVCFISAFALRLIVKTSANVSNAYENTLGVRYKKWYGRDLTIGNPGQEYWEQVKNFIESDKRLRITWVLTISKQEDIIDQDSVAAGINKYLAVTPLSYGGMQAQNMFMQAWHRTKIPPDFILQEGHCPGTARAFDTIAMISAQYEPKTAGSEIEATEATRANGTAQLSKLRRFRYARLFSPGFFSALQAKEAAQAIYLFACLLKKVVNFDANQDPDKIVVVGQLGDDTKAVLRAAADEIYGRPAGASTDLYSGTMLNILSRQTANPPAAVGAVGLPPVNENVFAHLS
ncbi:putative nucleocapsid [Cytorhabdovirus tiliae]|uniref:Nucleoprotein n=1 Tax=Cytorhabdovirus sp. 'tiliae' TaxID=3004219 RepID=A0A9J7CAZ0_9RHAB|nr:putative nucleocapsid [Cytorhabdovirus tiliae]